MLFKLIFTSLPSTDMDKDGFRIRILKFWSSFAAAVQIWIGILGIILGFGIFGFSLILVRFTVAAAVQIWIKLQRVQIKETGG